MMDDLQRDGYRMSGGFGQALAVLFGLPYGAPVRMSFTFADTVSLVQVNGFAPASPSPAEVQATLTGAYAAMLTVMRAQVNAVDLLKERVTDA